MTYHLNLTNESLPGIFWGETPPLLPTEYKLRAPLGFFLLLVAGPPA